MVRKKPIIISIAYKEVLHILKDPRSLLILFLMPILQLVMFGYALKMEIQTIKIGVIDYSQSAISRQLIESFKGSEFFHLFPFAGEEEQVDVLFKNRDAHAVMIIPIDFIKDMTRETLVPVQFLIDAADPNAGTMIRNYINQIIISFNESRNEVLPIPFEFRGTLLYNPDQKSTYFFVPGIVALLLVMISALLTVPVSCGKLGLTQFTVSVAVSITNRSRSGVSGSTTIRVSEPGTLGVWTTKSMRSSTSIVHCGGEMPSGQIESSVWLPDSKAATWRSPLRTNSERGSWAEMGIRPLTW